MARPIDLGVRPTAGERLAALVALVSLGAAIIVVIVGVRASWGATSAAVVGLLMGVVAAWYALGRHGVHRTVAVVAAAAGVAVLVAGFVGAGTGDPAGVSDPAGRPRGRAGRAALRRSVRALRRVALVTHAGAAGAATGPADQPEVRGREGGASPARRGMSGRGIEPIVLGPGDDLLQLAERAIADGADVIGMAGGDGHRRWSRPPPCATVSPTSSFPRARGTTGLDLGLDRSDVVGALDVFGDGVEHLVDVATVNGRGS